MDEAALDDQEQLVEAVAQGAFRDSQNDRLWNVGRAISPLYL
jgi:hypothetical protein